METRILPQEFSEVRAIQNDDGVWHIPGKAIVFNVRSRKIKSFFEVIMPTALDNAKMDDAISCWNHNTSHILGSVRNKTTTYEITGDAMLYDTLPPNNPTTNDMVIAPIVRRDVTGSSFMFNIAEGGDEWVRDPDGSIVRYVHKIYEVYEWGPVSLPVYMDTVTEVTKRSLDDFISLTKQQETVIRSQYTKMKLALYR
ncbi:HK97 family phage prohead protease [Dyadobacter sp. CY323]|uniref:HK97 family phage prohead protease n=1 Tax=Dyadobacter sp. CY323 TaxID=2907302 RepID=UPI001F230256|nr:HK97 family phage prohead protease [Dyadobacter sp. CY323]MCE6992094.1 HK97 family phage prohead protease [Dyadobacter sp. CY323]